MVDRDGLADAILGLGGDVPDVPVADVEIAGPLLISLKLQ